MAEILRISAKNLGALALPGFYPRCFWLRMKVGIGVASCIATSYPH